MFALITDLFQNGPPEAILGWLLFCGFTLFGVACLTIGSIKHAHSDRPRRRRVRRARR